jgi:hypothetical protein
MFESNRKFTIMATEAQIAANRANAQLSTGPSSPEGKAKSSHNALKTGLTGRTILLPTDDVAAYQRLIATIEKKFRPSSDEEKLIVQSIADTEWRLLRIPVLEAGLYAFGRNEFAGEFPSEADPQVRAAMIEAHIFRTYRKELNSLTLQESRLRKQLEKHTAELVPLQQKFDAIEYHRRNLAMREFSRFAPFKSPGPAADFGFELTKDYLALRSDVYLRFGYAALPQFDRDWKEKYHSKAA